jgi:hypothetical protein
VHFGRQLLAVAHQYVIGASGQESAYFIFRAGYGDGTFANIFAKLETAECAALLLAAVTNTASSGVTSA